MLLRRTSSSVFGTARIAAFFLCENKKPIPQIGEIAIAPTDPFHIFWDPVESFNRTVFVTESVSCIELSLNISDILQEISIDQLDHMKSVNNRDRIGEILIHISQIGSVHIRDQVFDPGSFPAWDLSEVWKRVFFPAADDKIDRLSCDEILKNQGIFAVL